MRTPKSGVHSTTEAYSACVILIANKLNEVEDTRETKSAVRLMRLSWGREREGGGGGSDTDVALELS